MKNIELYINDEQVVLPEDFSITYIETNRAINKSIDYTYDFDISLEHWKNAEIFGYLFRKNKIDFPKNMPAALRIDYKEINGIVIVLSNTEREAKCQFVSKSSTYDYLMESKVYELDWGEAVPAVWSPSQMWYVVYDFYKKGTVHHIYPRVVCDKGDIENGADRFGHLTDSSKFVLNELLTRPKYGAPVLCMQPYLMYYIDKLPELFGCKMAENVLNNNDFAKRIYIANTVMSYKYGDKLPDWTLAEFIKEIENFFNVSIVIDMNNRTVSVLSVDNVFDSIDNGVYEDIVDIDDIVLDDYVREFEKDGENSKIDNKFESQEIAFEHQSSDLFYQHQMLSDEMIKQCKVKEFNNINEIVGYILNLSDYSNKKTIYRDKATGKEYFAINARYYHENPDINNNLTNLFSVGGSALWLYDKALLRINKLRVSSGSYDRALKLKIVPAPLRAFIWQDWDDVNDVSRCMVQMPMPLNRYKLNSNAGFTDSMYEGERPKPSGNVLEVALACSSIDACKLWYGNIIDGQDIPFGTYIATITSYIDDDPEFGFRINAMSNWTDYPTWFQRYRAVTKEHALTPTYIKQNFYKRSLANEKVYTFTIRNDRRLNCRQTFRYDGGYYIPISLEWKTGTELVKGKFYKII